MISGYLPGPEAIEAVGKIAKELAQRGPGPFFWGKLSMSPDPAA